jgi:hypothetical protein
MWGNDPALKESDFLGGTLSVEGWVNPDSPIVQYRTSPPGGIMPPRVMGWAGRGNGPVDNPVSSCLSCHSTSQLPARSSMIPQSSLPEADKLRWFRNLAVGESFDASSKTLDFSLQLGVGIQNQQGFQRFVRDLGGVRTSDPRRERVFVDSREPLPPDQPGATPRQYRFTREP